MRENFIEKKFAEAVKKTGSMPLKFTSPGTAGVPDRIVLIPGGRILFVELKKPGEKLRPLQEKRKKDFENLGFKVEVVDSIQRIEEVCHEIQTTQLPGIRHPGSD
ncbi:VRR-NUC domain-containing protein [Cytobacillus firmus]|uniref:VRR-NUC domain-containing protein n=1 Tax=Cytobacillus firmus TaxID=1399 RepID=UPI0018CCBEC4|nr:VRR-NUC domain-containing protein [Cytobacillus firmus]MBG9657833.1 nuclease [Cytobacillus firmus]MED1904838.1 VRR-NUC domain-containing protein [Cytobacillus firmus]